MCRLVLEFALDLGRISPEIRFREVFVQQPPNIAEDFHLLSGIQIPMIMNT